MYDFWLGGHDNFAVDWAAALKVSEAAPEAQLMAVENRKFLRRVVRYLAADAGIITFLDIGTGLPTQGNVHKVAQDINPDARVVYVDVWSDAARPGRNPPVLCRTGAGRARAGPGTPLASRRTRARRRRQGMDPRRCWP
jgi:hypothetical protein